MSQLRELKEAVRGAEDWVAVFMRQFGWPDRERAWLVA